VDALALLIRQRLEEDGGVEDGHGG
jgi:hypothetical protein